MAKAKGPQFLRFYIPVLETLRELGGSGQPSEVTDIVLEKAGISEQEQSETLKNGASRVRNQVAWARFYLAKAGFMESSKRGVWTLTEKGMSTEISESDVLELFKQVQTGFGVGASNRPVHKKEAPEPDEEETPSPAAQPENLLELLRSLSPNGFERICKRLLRESGFQQVVVTGQTGDGGIDGHGVLQVNPFVSFKVLFQCKRYVGAVTVSQVRDFRGAMTGRADKGIIITTGTFTSDAAKEARRDGAPPLELVNGEELVKLFERFELGVRPKVVYEIDHDFFNEYR